MTIHKCDICMKEIDLKKGSVNLGNNGYFSTYFLCSKCGKPVLDFMKKKGLGKK